MRIFRFEKWFVDVLTADRDYMIVFYTITEVFGFKICFVEVNIGSFEDTGSSGGFYLNQKLHLLKRENHTLSVREGDILLEAGLGKMKLSLREIDLELDFNPVHHSDFDNPGMGIPKTGRTSICWKPLFLKTLVSGKIKMHGDKRQILGNGYVDYLISARIPFNMPVRQLYWGRLHSQDCDLTYSLTIDKNNAVTGYQMILKFKGNHMQFDTLDIQPGEWEMYDPPGISFPTGYTLEAFDDRYRIKMKITHTKPAIVSEFVENTSELGWLRLALLKKISKNPRGIKFFSNASLEIIFDGQTTNLDDLILIDEYVKFT